MSRRRIAATIAAAAILFPYHQLTGCSALPRYKPDEAADESERLRRFLEEAYLTRLDRRPTELTRLGNKRRYGEWDDWSDKAAREENEIIRRDLERLRSDFDFDRLSDAAQLDYRLFQAEAARDIEGFRWRFHDYPVNQMHGEHAEIPAFLINSHRIEVQSDAEAYVSRLRGIKPLFDQLIEGLRRREELGVLPPAFVYPLVIEDCKNLIKGAPFEADAGDSTLFADFKKKLASLALDDEARSMLVASAERALRDAVRPAYEKLIATLLAQAEHATDDDGAWKLPDGGELYRFALRRHTTTDLSPDEIHSIGLSEVDRIHREMRAIMVSVGFEGTLPQFFGHLRSDVRFYYPNDAAGREAYLADARAIVEGMRARLEELFLTVPQAPFVVRAVEPFRERSAGKAFYNRGTPDGSRPGVYYANLYNMADMPRYQMEALAYHEAIPGHHMQLSIAQELDDLPSFRQHARYTAYSEGWGLYTEYLPKELGFYSDPYSDFGRLAMELWRACRLVVDTGIHSRRWTRGQAIAYLRENTPNPEGDCRKAIERYIVMPGQATAYKIGMMKILQVRRSAEERLGERFDIRAFHDVVLRSGPVPLGILGERVERWIESGGGPG